MACDYMAQVAADYEESIFRMAILMAAEEAGEKLIAEAREERKKLSRDLPIKWMEKALSKKALKDNLRSFGKATWKVGSRIAVIIMIIVTVSFSLIMSVDALRYRFSQLLLTFYDDHMEVGVQDTDGNGAIIEGSQPILITSDYVPSYIPDGFHIVSMTLDDNIYDITYKNEKGLIIGFDGYTNTASSNVNTENADLLETVVINGRSGLLIVRKDVYILTWSQDHYYFVLNSCVSKEETLRIARSVHQN